MPKRTNTFQQVVALVYEHLASDGSAVEESHMLVDRVTGDEREVDVCLTAEPAAGVKVIVSIEAANRKRPVDATWVEGQIGRHKDLPTSKLILVSGSGFTKGAKAKAEAGNALAISREEIEADPRRTVVARLGTVWAKTMKWTPEQIAIFVRAPDGEIVQAPLTDGDDPAVFASDGTRLSSISDEMRCRANANADELADALNMRDRAESMKAKFRMSMHGWEVEVAQEDGTEKTMDACLKWDVIRDDAVEATGFTPIEELAIRGELEIEVVEISLSHMRLGETPTAYGMAQLDGGEGLLVVTEDDDGNTKISLRAADGNIADLKPDTSLGSPPRK